MNLVQEAENRGIRVPSKSTLAKYGLQQWEWCKLLKDQGWVCPICEKAKATWNTDHEHVPGWHKKPPQERKRYVRGVLCWHCNKYGVPSNLSAAHGQNVADYLLEYERRRDGQG